MVKPLYIPNGKGWKGLTVTCLKCRTNVKDICKQTRKSLLRCPFPEKHKFKIVCFVPGIDNVRKTRVIETRDLQEAVKSAIDFQKEVKEGQRQKTKREDITKKLNRSQKNEDLSMGLLPSFARFIGVLHNEGVPEYLKHAEKSKDHLADVKRTIERFVVCLKNNQFEPESLSVENLSHEMIDVYYKFLIHDLKYSPRSVNKAVGILTQFENWFSEEFYPVKKYFARIPRGQTNHNPQALSIEEYNALLNSISPEGGLRQYEKGKKRERNCYRPWLMDGIKLGLLTGRRREEIISMRFSDIHERHGFAYIKVEDKKHNRIRKINNPLNSKYVYVPITQELKELIEELGYKEYKGTEAYLLAPQVQISRNRIMSDTLTRGFSHYIEKLNFEKKLTFKSLRKTYFTQLKVYMQGDIKGISGHSSDEILNEHYLDKEVLAKAAQGFKVFPLEDLRKRELEQIRSTTTIELKQKSIEK